MPFEYCVRYKLGTTKTCRWCGSVHTKTDNATDRRVNANAMLPGPSFPVFPVPFGGH